MSSDKSTTFANDATEGRYRFADIRRLAAALRGGEVSAVELATTVIDGLDGIGRGLGAVASLSRERAQEEAGRAQDRLDGGDADPLCAIPFGVKDTFAAYGAPTTWGSPYFEHQYFEDDAEVVARLHAAGGVLAAKLTMSELAGGGRPKAPGASLHGQARNPWNPSRYAGGSSGGSGAAVAAGLLPYALGTETAGSVVGPAAFCGITGLRTSAGLVSREGMMTLSWSMDKVGVLARSAVDCATVLRALTGAAAVESAPAPRDSGDAWIADVRVAFFPGEVAQADVSCRAALAAGIEEFRSVFPRFVDVAIDEDFPYRSVLETIMLAEAATGFDAALRDPAFRMTDAKQETQLRSGQALSAVDYLLALQKCDEARMIMRKLFDRADLLLSVSRPSTAPPLDEPRASPGLTMSDLVRAAANLTGCPGVSFPCGLAEDGLPVALHVVGPPGSDELLLNVTSAIQSVTVHHSLRPGIEHQR